MAVVSRDQTGTGAFANGRPHSAAVSGFLTCSGARIVRSRARHAGGVLSRKRAAVRRPTATREDNNTKRSGGMGGGGGIANVLLLRRCRPTSPRRGLLCRRAKPRHVIKYPPPSLTTVITHLRVTVGTRVQQYMYI